MNAPRKIEAAQAPAVLSAINAVMAHCAKEGISKDRKNQQQGYKFRGIDDVYNALCSVLATNKLVMLPFVQEMKREERQTKGGGVLNYTILTVDFKIACAEDGSSELVRVIGEAMDSADKSANKAQSAALKYAALQVFMIPTEGDNDADAHTPEVVTGPVLMSDADCTLIMQLIEATSTDARKFCQAFKIASVKELPADAFPKAKAMLEKKLSDAAKAAKTETVAEAIDDGIDY